MSTCSIIYIDKTKADRYEELIETLQPLWKEFHLKRRENRNKLLALMENGKITKEECFKKIKELYSKELVYTPYQKKVLKEYNSIKIYKTKGKDRVRFINFGWGYDGYFRHKEEKERIGK